MTVSAPTPEHAARYSVYDNLDRAATLSFRPAGLSQGVIPYLYQLARGERPIAFDIAEAVLSQPGSEIGLLTGASVPGYLPNGENDGPLGAVVLGRALRGLGYRVTVLAEAELLPMLNALFDYYGEAYDVVVLAKDDPQDHAATAPGLDMLIAVEKLGSNARHVMHGATGVSRNGTRAHVDGLVQRLNQANQLTVGIGDGGNEIGFGKLYREAREVVDYGKHCQCPCEDGIVTVTPTRLLYPVAVSNWGAYAVAAALALLSGEHSRLHTPEHELALLALATRVDCRDGGSGTARDWVDGVPGPTSAAIVEIFKSLVEQANVRFERAF